MASQLSMWKDEDPERFSEDGMGKRRRTKKKATKAGGSKERSTRKAAKKSTRGSSARKKERKAPPVEREYKTKSEHRYVLRRLAD